MDFTCKSGTTGENNTCQPQEASAADYGTVTHRSRASREFRNALIRRGPVLTAGSGRQLGRPSALGSVRRQQQRMMLQQILELELAGALEVDNGAAMRTVDLE
jgi:hypothetical protein